MTCSLEGLNLHATRPTSSTGCTNNKIIEAIRCSPVIGTSYIDPVSGTYLVAGCYYVLHFDIYGAKIKNPNEGSMPIFKPGQLGITKRTVTVYKNADALLIAP